VGQLARQHGLSDICSRHLVRRYGTRCFDVADLIHEDVSLRSPVIEGEPDLRAELLYQIRQEMAIYPQDSLRRRTRLALFHPELQIGNLQASGIEWAMAG